MPWSMSRSAPWAPSNRIRFPARREARPACEDLVAPIGLEEALLDRDDRLELVLQDRRVKEVRDPDSKSSDLVLVARPDSAAGRPRLELALPILLDAILDLVVGHHDVCPVADPQVLRTGAALPEVVEFLEEHAGFHDDAVRDHVHRSRPTDTP